MDEDKLKKDIEAPLMGEDDELPLAYQTQETDYEDDMVDYFDRELRDVERELEEFDTKIKRQHSRHSVKNSRPYQDKPLHAT